VVPARTNDRLGSERKPNVIIMTNSATEATIQDSLVSIVDVD
jgi:hypothetical protein